MKLSAYYIKVVQWSEEDACYVGSAPGLLGPCCHGDDEQEVFVQLCEIVEDVLRDFAQDGRPLPPPTATKPLTDTVSALL